MCLLDEEPKQKKVKHIKQNRNHEIKNKKKEINIKNEHFPSLINNNSTKLDTTQEHNIGYKSILKNEEKTKKKKEAKLKRGWIELGKTEKEKTYESNENLVEYLYFVDCMTNLYKFQKEEKLEILGEEQYEKNFKFPNYDYEYFNKLDEKYNKELEQEIKLSESEHNDYNSDNNI